MIKNIPNKYGLAALEEEINISHEGTYDFLYIPFDYQVIIVPRRVLVTWGMHL